MMDLVQFKEDIGNEIPLKVKFGGETPILDRLQIHLDNLDKPLTLGDLLNSKNMEHEFYISMLYQIVYPAKKKNDLKIYLNGEEVEGKSIRNKIQNTVIKVGADVIKTLKTHSKFLYKKDIAEVVGNAYKVIDDHHSFDTSFGGVGASSVGVYFIKELQSIGVDIKLENYETYSYS